MNSRHSIKFNSLQLRGDLFGGITTGVVALPLALAFGVQSGLGAAYGIYGAIFLGVVAALLGGTKMQISGPTGPMTVLTAAFIAEAVANYQSIEAATPFIVLTFVLIGLMQIALGVCRLGDLIKFIPYPVISGFMSGIGLIIISLQLYPAIGLAAPLKIHEVFIGLHNALQDINYAAFALSVSTILLIYTVPKVTKAVPSTLVALTVMTVVAHALAMQVPLIGDIPKGFPVLQLAVFKQIKFEMFTVAFMPALTIAVVGAIDSLLTSVVADNLTKTTHNSNQELIGQGTGNAVSALFLGLPGAGATMRTVVNINSGGQGRLSGVIHSLVLLFILVGAGQYAEKIPLSVLAGILITVGISIIDYRGMRYLKYIPRSEAMITLVVATLTIFVNLLHAVGVGIVLACIVFMKRMTDIAEAKSRVAPLDFSKDLPWYDESTIPSLLKEHVYIKHLHGPLFFGFTSHLRGLVNAIPDIKVVIIRMSRVPYMDETGLFAFQEACEYLASKQIQVVVSGLQQQPSDMLNATSFHEAILAQEFFFENFPKAIAYLEQQALAKAGCFAEKEQE